MASSSSLSQKLHHQSQSLGRSSHGRTQQGNKLIVLSTLQLSQSHTSIITLTSSKTHSHLMRKISEFPSKERNNLYMLIEKENGGGRKISEFNDLLMGLLLKNEHDLALKLYGELSRYGVEPDCWTFSIAIRCLCKNNDLIEAKKLLDHMVEIGFRPSVVTCTILINSLCKSGKLKKAYEVFDAMDKIGCKPTIQTYNCLLKGMCYVGRVEEAYEKLMDIKKTGLRPDFYTYTAVMDGFCKVGRTDEAMELLNEALEMGLSPNVVTFNTLFNGYCKKGKPQKGINLLRLMKEHDCAPDTICYSTLLHGLLKWGAIRVALKVYREMTIAGFEVDSELTHTLLRKLCIKSWQQKDMVQDAKQVFENLTNGSHSAIEPNVYGFIIRSLCLGKDVDKALVHLRQIIQMGYLPRTITFNNMIQALCFEGRVDEALMVLALMSEHCKIPSRTSYNAVIKELNQNRRLLDAHLVYCRALKQGVTPIKKPRRWKSQEIVKKKLISRGGNAVYG